MGIYKYPRTYPCKTEIFSLKKDGNKQLSAHFKLKEFQSKDGDDIIVICPDLINNCLEPLYDLMHARAINITSGYRTISHSKSVGGAGASDNHHMGMAADIKVKKQDGTYYSAKEIACALQDLPWEHGIGLMNTSVHVDTGSKYWFDETRKINGKYAQVADWHIYTGITKRFNDSSNTNANQSSSISQQNPKENTQPQVKPQRTYKYKIGDNVVFSTCYKSSTSPISSAISATKMSKNHGVITKIVDAQNPYLLDNGLCWVNDGDIRGYYSVDNSTTHITHRGTAYKLTCDKLAVRKSNNSNSTKVGEYYRGNIFYVVEWKGNWAKLESGNWMYAKKYCIKV